ncbi:MAG: PilZ domain-containing protein [Verrucomicrobia bacterium]|nr:PilZ domain-containing protein [Verrucomicrobiota bacterium]
MSSGKLDTSGVFQTVTLETETARLALTGDVVRVHKNGIELQTPKPLTAWREMSVDLQPPNGGRKLRCTGVVVACHGNRHTGYLVSMVFLNLTKHSQEQLRLMADSRPA